MIRRKSRRIFILLLLTMSMGVCGCGAKDRTAQSPEGEKAENVARSLGEFAESLKSAGSVDEKNDKPTKGAEKDSGTGDEKDAVTMDECKKTTFVKKGDGLEIRLTYYTVGDRVYFQTADNILEYSALGVTREAAMERMEPIVKQYQSREGVTDDVTYEEKRLVEKMTVNFQKADPSAIGKLPGAQFEGSGEVRLSKSRPLLEKEGYVEE